MKAEQVETLFEFGRDYELISKAFYSRSERFREHVAMVGTLEDVMHEAAVRITRTGRERTQEIDCAMSTAICHQLRWAVYEMIEEKIKADTDRRERLDPNPGWLIPPKVYTPDIEVEEDQEALDRLLEESISALPSQRMQFVARKRMIEGMTYKEIAKLMGVTKERIRQLMGKIQAEFASNPKWVARRYAK